VEGCGPGSECLDVAIAYAWHGYDVIALVDSDVSVELIQKCYTDVGVNLGATTAPSRFQCRNIGAGVNISVCDTGNPVLQKVVIYVSSGMFPHVQDIPELLPPKSVIVSPVSLELQKYSPKSIGRGYEYTKMGVATAPCYPDAKLAVLVLCVNSFGHKMWEEWGGTDIGILAHSSFKDKNYDDVPVKYRVNKQVPTTWAGLGVVYAEVRLLFEAARRFPNASHFAFLSESCVPRRSCKDILRMLDSEWSGKSVLQVFRTSEFWASHQNKLLARHHVMSHILCDITLSKEATLQAVDKRVQQVACQFASGKEVNGFALPKQVDNTGEMCTALLPEGPECLAFDEVVIPMLLLDSLMGKPGRTARERAYEAMLVQNNIVDVIAVWYNQDSQRSPQSYVATQLLKVLQAVGDDLKAPFFRKVRVGSRIYIFGEMYLCVYA
jgi:hypothetical protein